MKWVSFAVGAVMVAAVFVFFPAPPPAVGIGVMSLGLMLLLDWSLDNCIGFASWGGLELRSEEIEADFYSFERARWRYLLAITTSVALAGVFGLSDPTLVRPPHSSAASPCMGCSRL